MAHPAQPAGTYALVVDVRRSVVDRQCPLVVVVSGPYVARLTAVVGELVQAVLAPCYFFKELQ
jgi:hypothetical protein